MNTYQDPKRETELIFVNVLWDKTGIRFYPSKDSEERELPIGVVKVASAKPLVGGKDPRGYLCIVKVMYVSHMDEIGSEEHGQNLAKIEDGLMTIPNLEVDEYLLKENHVKVAGLHIDEISETTEDQSLGDIFTCTVGVVGIDCPVES
jgi:hypothetical protein